MTVIRSILWGAGVLVSLSACQATPPVTTLQITLPSFEQDAPVYTATATVSPTFTLTPSATSTLTATPTLTHTPTITATATASATPTPSPLPTVALHTLTPVSPLGLPPAATIENAPLPAPSGWSCGNVPCEADLAGHKRRIGVPSGFEVQHVGRFNAQVQQITYGRDGLLYATALTDGISQGAILTLNPQDGAVSVYSEGMLNPVGLAFQPDTDVLYVSARASRTQGGMLYRIPEGGGTPQTVLDTLPCCWREVDNQVNGMVFGMDGYLYVGVSSLSDHGEADNPTDAQPFQEPHQLEATILQINPHTQAIGIYAKGIRHPFDLDFDSRGRFYATDSGTVEGIGDRLLRLEVGAHYRFPYYGLLGCSNCPSPRADLTYSDSVWSFPAYTLPRGIAVYKGVTFPQNLFNNVFVALWNDNGNGQRVVRLDPATLPTDEVALASYQPQPFVTGLLRPMDVIVSPSGTLVVADSIYGDIWEVRYRAP